MDGARARVSLGGTFIKVMDQENAGRTPCGVHMAHGCYGFAGGMNRLAANFSLRIM
jgi:hypothetical protein